MSYIEQLAVEVKNNCKAIDDVTDFAIKEFILKFFKEYQKVAMYDISITVFSEEENQQ